MTASAWRSPKAAPLRLENTAGASGTLVRRARAAHRDPGGDERLGLCLDSCHLFASGYDIRTPEPLDAVRELTIMAVPPPNRTVTLAGPF